MGYVKKEIWRPIADYENSYEVSNRGGVRSKDRSVSNGKVLYEKKGHAMKLSNTTTGYYKIALYKNGKRSEFKVHRLVAAAFIPRVEGKNLINHKDGNPKNNDVTNLEWCTQSENLYHSYENQLRKNNFNLYKERMAEKYSNSDVGIMELCREFKVSHSPFRKYLISRGIRIRSISESKDFYKIDRRELAMDFDRGLTNKEIAEKYKTNKSLIATYKCKHKKGELL